MLLEPIRWSTSLSSLLLFLHKFLHFKWMEPCFCFYYLDIKHIFQWFYLITGCHAFMINLPFEFGLAAIFYSYGPLVTISDLILLSWWKEAPSLAHTNVPWLLDAFSGLFSCKMWLFINIIFLQLFLNENI